MRYKETKGHLPFVSSKVVGDHGVANISHSSRSSDLESKDAHQPVESVNAIPERTI